jgi:triacylglycerol lipase
LVIHRLYKSQQQTCYDYDYIPYPDVVFGSNAGKYSKDTCKFLYVTSKNVSRSNCKNLNSVPIPPGFDKYERITVKKYGYRKITFGYIFVSSSSKQLILAFTGTSYPYQWRKILEIWQANAKVIHNYKKGMRLHSGFYQMFCLIQSQLRRVLSEYRGYKLFITGNSLGGALSVIAALDLSGKEGLFDRDNLIVYTFGSPRAGNHIFASKYNKLVPHTFRVFNTEDLYATLIPSLGVGDNLYEHVGKNIPFTINVRSYTGNHGDAYTEYLL